MTDATPADLPVSVADLTPEDRDFLLAVADAGEAATSEIKAAAGLERNQVHTRYEKFGEDGHGLIEVERVGSNHGGFQQNAASLTDAGGRLVDSGLLDEIHDPNANIADLREQVETLHARVTREKRELERRLRRKHRDAVDRVGEAEEEVDRLRYRFDEAESTHLDGLGEFYFFILPALARELGVGEIAYPDLPPLGVLDDERTERTDRRAELRNLQREDRATLAERVEELEAENRDLRERLADLERRVA